MHANLGNLSVPLTAVGPGIGAVLSGERGRAGASMACTPHAQPDIDAVADSSNEANGNARPLRP